MEAAREKQINKIPLKMHEKYIFFFTFSTDLFINLYLFKRMP